MVKCQTWWFWFLICFRFESPALRSWSSASAHAHNVIGVLRLTLIAPAFDQVSIMINHGWTHTNLVCMPSTDSKSWHHSKSYIHYHSWRHFWFELFLHLTSKAMAWIFRNVTFSGKIWNKTGRLGSDFISTVAGINNDQSIQPCS